MPLQEGRFIGLFDLRPLAKSTRSGLNAPIRLVFVLLILLIGIGGWTTRRHTRLLFEYQSRVSSSYRLLAQLQVLTTTAVDAEAGVRGYLTTSQERYLVPYREAVSRLERRLADLDALSAEAGMPAGIVEQLTARIYASFAHFERIHSMALAGDTAAAIESLRTGDGKLLMDGLRRTIDDAQDSEQVRLASLQALARQSYATSELTGLLVAVAGVSMIVVLYNMILRFDRLRARTTMAIEDARERFEVALGSIGDAVIVTDADGHMVYCNDRCRSTLLFRDEDMGRPLEELFDSIADGSNQLYDSLVRRAFREPGTHRSTVDTAIRLSDGSRILVDATAARLKGRADKPRGVVLVLRDVTERRERDLELARSHERFRSLVLATSQIVWTTDTDGHVRDDSPSWRAYTGQTYEQWRGLGWLDALHPEDRAQTLADWRDAVAEERPFAGEYRLRRADGSYCWNLVRAVPVKDADGTLREWVGMNHDIEEIKRAEASRRRASRRKDEFIALLAHELRNPLAPLRNGLELLKSGNGPDAERAIAMMDRQVKHIVRLIDDLLDVSRIGQGKLELLREELDLRPVLGSAVEALATMIAAKQQDLRVRLPETPLWVHGDPARLLQIFTNLLHNAVKYSATQETIWLEAEREGMNALVVVRDTGQGIDPEFQPRIWDMFRQGADQVQRSDSGLGIGLTLVRQLVELHGGTVAVSSGGIGLGSEFSVRIPACTPGEHRDADDDPAPLEAVRTLRILVIDDNEDSLESTAMLLRLGGHHVRTAALGEDGVAEFAEFAPELVLCDIRMPDLSGYEVARRLRSRMAARTCVLVAMTGFGTRMDREASREAGFDRHLVKPMDPVELSTLLREVATLTSTTPTDPRP